MYYDPDLGSYYHYDGDSKTYTLHSRVQLPEHQLRKRKREVEEEVILVYGSDEEFTGEEMYSKCLSWSGNEICRLASSVSFPD